MAVLLTAGLSPSNQAVPVSTEATSSPKKTQSTFDSIVYDYFDFTLRRNPTWATDLGEHAWDGELEDVSAQAFEATTYKNKEFLSRLDQIDAEQLDSVSKLDLPLLKSHLQGELLESEQIQLWRRNPDKYSTLASQSVFTLMKRDFAPLRQRLESCIAREKRIPGMLAEARKNLANPPAVYTQIALQQLPGMIDFFNQSVPDAFVSVKDEQLQKEFKSENNKVIESLRAYQQFLKDDLSQRSSGSFALGPALFAKKLLYEEMVDEPVNSLLERGNRELSRLKHDFIETAKEIDATKSPQAVYQAVAVDHPKPEQLISSTQYVLEELREFCLHESICSIPSEERVKVQETPPFDRALSFASMDTPGPFEKKATEAYYHVTLPEPTWTPQKTEEHMRDFCRMDLINTSVHEAYPGHYVQFLWLKQAPSKIRKLVGCSSNGEGWAHYCEEMMLEQGLGNGDRKLKLVQLHDALLRVCRYIVGIKMHTAGMTLEEGITFFMNEGFQERTNAEREAKRGTIDATYLVYTLGKMEILSLRADYKKAKGTEFSLKEFHDRFLAQGFPPLKIVRAALLGTPAPPNLANQSH
jgi:hypothetical protein